MLHASPFVVPQVAASPNTAAGVLHGREVIRDGLTRWRETIGQGTVAVTWTRNGSQLLPLLRLTEWSPRAIYGSSGALSCTVTGATTHSLPVTDVLIDYRIVGDQMRLRGETLIAASVLGIDTSTPKAIGDAKPVGFIDPISLLSVASMVWQLLHPQCDVSLPGQMSAEATMVGDALVVTFKDAPSIRVVMLFTFQLKVEAVSISESKVVVTFSGSRFIRQKTFEVK